MRDIRMIVTDLDGTYLRSDKTVSEYMQRVIDRLRAQGVLFVVATARPVRAVNTFLPWIHYDAGIFHNGAVLWNESKRIGGFGIENPENIIEQILRDKPETCIAAEADDTLYANFDSERIWPGVDYIATKGFDELKGQIADKLIIETSSIEAMKQYEPYIPKELYMQLSENRIAMVMNREATKPNGIRLMANLYGVELGQVVAFGDDYNDIDMLKECGIGVAVANALEPVKEAADEICGGNDEDGVAHWLENYLLK